MVADVLLASQFISAVQAAIPRFSQQAPNAEQVACILHDPAVPLQIVAGPGSGKTTVLVLRALRHVVVDGLLPEQVLLTTFTKKAAKEIRTRLIEWGMLLIQNLRASATGPLADHLANVDINRFVTGTLDSICEEALRDARSATDAAPALLEGFAANAILLRKGLTGSIYTPQLDAQVGALLQRYTFGNDPIRTRGEAVGVIRPLYDRFSHDLVDLQTYRAASPGHELLVQGYEPEIFSTEAQKDNDLLDAQNESKDWQFQICRALAFITDMESFGVGTVTGMAHCNKLVKWKNELLSDGSLDKEILKDFGLVTGKDW